MTIYPVVAPGLAIHSYIVADEKSKNALVIDPTRDIDPILNILKEHGLNLLYILETHVHADFISGAKELKQRLKGAPLILCSSEGGPEWVPKYADKTIKDKDTINLGSQQIMARHTPGHTPEHLIYILNKNILPTMAFTGDFLFAGCIGRPDLINDKVDLLTEKLYHSIETVLSDLPDSLVLHPAHGAGSLCGKAISNSETTLGKERQSNPALKKQPFDQWKKDVFKEMPKAPQYFQRVKRLNVQGVNMLNSNPREIQGDQLLKEDLNEVFILDIRNQDEFANGHIPGSLNIPMGPNFARWAGDFVPDSQEIIIIANKQSQALEAIKALHMIGMDNIKGYSFPGRDFLSQSFPYSEGALFKDQRPDVQIIDVRTPSEWNNGHIPHAVHIEIDLLPLKINELPKNKTLAFICGTSYRASIAASLAQKNGYDSIVNIKGGMQAWNQAGLPIQKP